jgi:hypothetical protein
MQYQVDAEEMRFEPRMGFVTDVNSAVPRVLEANTVAMTTSFLIPTYFVLIPTFLTLSISPCAWSIYSILRCIRLAHYDLMFFIS